MVQRDKVVCPKCGRYPGLGRAECPWCGVVFEKLRTAADEGLGSPPVAARAENGGAWREFLRTLARPVNPFVLAGRALVWTGLALWSLGFLFSPLSANYAGSSLLHGVNLIFHEAGHVLFGLAGEWPGVLGGSLGQLLMPAVCVGAFLWSEREPFGASVALWWTAESLLDLAPYVNDAGAQVLPLLGGVTGRDVPGYHDWNRLLGAVGWLGADHAFALVLHGAGLALMAAALGGGAWVLVRQWGNRERD